MAGGGHEGEGSVLSPDDVGYLDRLSAADEVELPAEVVADVVAT